MKHLWIVALALSAPGCFSLPFVTKEEAKPPAAAAQRQPVTPEQVKEANAYKVAESLDEEVTLDETTPAQKPDDKDKDKDKKKK